MDSAPSPEPKTDNQTLTNRLKTQIVGKLANSDRFRNWVGFIFILVGLLSTIAAATIDGAAADLTGRFGIWSTAALFALFGKAAYLFGPALILSGFRGLHRNDWQTYVSGLLGNLSLLWGCSVFLQLSNQSDSGIIGEQTGYLLEFLTGRTGSYLIDIILIFAGILLLLQIPFDQVKERFAQLINGNENKDQRSNNALLNILEKLSLVAPLFAVLYQSIKKQKSDLNQTSQSKSQQETPNQIQNKTITQPITNQTERPINEFTFSKNHSVISSEPKRESATNMNTSRPPWIQKVILTDNITATQPTETESNQKNTNRWRPNHGFDIVDSSDSLLDWNQAVFDESENSLTIEEDHFLLKKNIKEATAVMQKPAATSERIIFDREKNRYLFTSEHEDDQDLLGRLEIDDSLQISEITIRPVNYVDFEPDDRNSIITDYELELQRDNAEEDDSPNAAHYITTQDATYQERLVDTESEEETDAIKEKLSTNKKIDESLVIQPDYNSIKQSNVSQDQNSNRPIISDIVFSENRFSRYRLSRRIAKQTITSEDDTPEAEIAENWQRLEKVMSDFGIQAKVVGTIRGPMITMYEVQLEPGIRVNRILNIENEIRMNLAALSVRILAPIPGKSTIGIELPNRNRKYVSIGDLANTDPEFASNKRQLSIALGKDITGTNRYLDLTRLPHLLIAGATGSGKSVFMNSVIGSLLFNRSPDEVRFLMIDPKMVELKLFEGIPHLLYPVITDVRLADRALNWAVQEMENRYQLLSSVKCRDIRTFNDRVKNGSLPHRLMPYIVVLIDELSDLMMVAAKEVEDSIIRLTQKARAVGIHVIMATQRPSVDVITALIKANCPARISFQVSQRTDSRVILDTNGAEALLGRGDMLYKSPTAADPARIQSPMISDQEIEQLVNEASRFGQPRFIDLPISDSNRNSSDEHSDVDESLLEDAWQIILESGKTSTSYIQRRLRIGYNRAATLIERLEQMGYLSEPIGNRPREILKHEILKSTS